MKHIHDKEMIRFLENTTLEFVSSYKYSPEYSIKNDKRIVVFNGETYRTEFRRTMNFSDYGSFIDSIEENVNQHSKISYINIYLN